VENSHAIQLSTEFAEGGQARQVRRNLLGLVFKAPLKLLFLHVFFLCKFTSYQQNVVNNYINYTHI